MDLVMKMVGGGSMAGGGMSFTANLLSFAARAASMAQQQQQHQNQLQQPCPCSSLSPTPSPCSSSRSPWRMAEHTGEKVSAKIVIVGCNTGTFSKDFFSQGAVNQVFLGLFH